MKLSTNEVTLIGFVGGDTQSKETKNHNKYAVVSMATTESWKDKNGDWQRRTTWHRLVGWGAICDSMLRNLAKGAFIQVRLRRLREVTRVCSREVDHLAWRRVGSLATLSGIPWSRPQKY